MTLQKYRLGKDLEPNYSNIEFALNKLLDIDIGELIEHPQWQELLSITLYYLTIQIGDHIKIMCMQFLLRLIMGLPGPQACDATVAFLTYLFHQLSDFESPVEGIQILPPSHPERNHAIAKAVGRDLEYSQVSCLAAILCYNATGTDTTEPVGIARHFLGLQDRDIDRVVSLTFLLLGTRGYVVRLEGDPGKLLLIYI